MSPCVCVCARDYVGVFAKAYLRVRWYVRACVIALYVRSRYICIFCTCTLSPNLGGNKIREHACDPLYLRIEWQEREKVRL